MQRNSPHSTAGQVSSVLEHHRPGVVLEEDGRAREAVTHQQPGVGGYVHDDDTGYRDDVPEHVPCDGVVYLVIDFKPSKESKAKKEHGEYEETPVEAAKIL